MERAGVLRRGWRRTPVIELLADGVAKGQPAGQGTLVAVLRKSFSRLVTRPKGAVG